MTRRVVDIKLDKTQKPRRPRVKDRDPALDAPIELPTEAIPPRAPIPGTGRMRVEIRRSCASQFDTQIRTVLEDYVASVAEGYRDPETGKKWYSVKDIAQVTAIGNLYASVGIGFLGTNQIDPAEIPQLPPPVFATYDPAAPLPDGKDG